ncbi:hypothetical protein [Rhodonellum sp.]|uniref:hypothetical protein n=1 Tax=Rhodonellum sp. TaxID=2231180 RepID=UPI0027256FAB|nr:hypothetical protein [Rhodonellum sp.]MDO9553430.1 hypothetical protein [Rhodonellum sp.]
MKKLIFFLSFTILFLPILSSAQQKDYEWRIGVSGGYTNYYGDLSPYKVQGLSNWNAIKQLLYFNDNYFDQYSFKISIEKQLSPTIGLMFSYGQYEFSMSDRYVKRDGALLGTNRNFDRALNFQNQSRDMGLAFVFKTDNDRLLPATSLLAPYFTLGFGLVDFEVSGDLLDGDGNRYDYASGNVVNDGIYETNLYALKTESDKGYDLGAFYTNLGLGIRLRLGPRVELFAQSDFIYTFSDHLDDVSGNYRTEYENDFQAYAAKPGTNIVDPANPLRGDGKSGNDWIIYHGLGLKFNFGSNKKSYKAPRLSTVYPDYDPVIKEIPLAQIPTPEPDTLKPLPTGNNYTYYTNIQLVDPARMDSLIYKTQMLTWDQQITARKSQILSGKMEENKLQQIQSKIQEQYELLKADTLLRQNERDSLVKASENILFDLRYSLDSLGKSDRGFQLEIDSITELKKNFRVVGSPGLSDSRMDSLFNWSTSVDTLFRLPVTKKTSDISGSKLVEIQKTEEGAEPTKEAGIVSKENTLVYEEGRIFKQSDSETGLRTNTDFQNRIDALERETRRLQSERDSLRALPRETIYLNNTYRDVSRADRSQQRTPLQTSVGVQADEDLVRRERGQRKWWLLGGLFGGAVATKALTKDPTPDQVAVPDSLSVGKIKLDSVSGDLLPPLEYDSVNKMPFAPKMIIEDSLSRISEPSFKSAFSDVDVRAPQVIRDTVFLDADPKITLLKSKVEVFFKSNQKVPDEDQIIKLAPLVDFVKDNPEYSLSLTGFADNTGNLAYNLKLIQTRINSVLVFLLDQYGLGENQIQTEIGGQVVRSPNRSANDNDRKVEVRVVLKD